MSSLPQKQSSDTCVQYKAQQIVFHEMGDCAHPLGPLSKGRQHDWWVRYFKWGIREQLKHGRYPASGVKHVWAPSYLWDAFETMWLRFILVCLIQDACTELNFCLHICTVCVCACVHFYVCVYIYIYRVGTLLWLAALQIQDTKIQQFHNSLLILTDLFSLLNHNHSTFCKIRWQGPLTHNDAS